MSPHRTATRRPPDPISFALAPRSKMNVTLLDAFDKPVENYCPGTMYSVKVRAAARWRDPPLVHLRAIYPAC